MQKNLFSIFFLVFATSLTLQANDILSDISKLKEDVESGLVSSANCANYFSGQLENLAEERLFEIPADQIKETGKSILTSSWQARLAIHKRLADLAICRPELRSLIFRLRSIEDLAADRHFQIKQVTSEEIGDFQQQPTPLMDNEFYHGYLGSSGQIEKDQVDLHNGDLLITVGASNFSSMLISITEFPMQLDHFALINKDQTDQLWTLESYAQLGGVSRFPIVAALRNENPRMALLRMKDSQLGAKASNLIFEKIKLGELDKTKQIPYDFSMDLSQSKSMTCSAVAYWGLNWASDGQFIIPQERSQVSQALQPLLEETGIKYGPMLTAQDIELDSRFDLLLEFRDYRLVQDIRLKQAIAIAIFKWMKEKNYKLQATNQTHALNIIFLLKGTKLFKTLMKFATGKDIPEGTPKGFIKTLSQFSGLADILRKRLNEENQKQIAQTGWSLTHNQMANILEQYRQQDYSDYENGYSDDFHRYFQPPNMNRMSRTSD